MKKAFYIVLILLLVSVGVNVWQYAAKQEQQVRTTVKVDTVRYTVCVPVDSQVVRKRIVYLPVVKDKITHELRTNYAQIESQTADTLLYERAELRANYAQNTHDSVAVEIPITQKEYVGKDYHAWLSGYLVSLDSIETYNTTTTIMQPAKKQKRWGLGVQAGYGVGKNGLQPYVGIGVSYNLFGF